MKTTFRKVLAAMLCLAALGMLAPAGVAGVLESHAATQLESPDPYIPDGDKFSVTWERVRNAGSYDVKLTLSGKGTGKTVTRSYSTTQNKLDLTLFAADCDVSVSVRAVPATAKKKTYSASAWTACDEEIQPLSGNATAGFAGISKERFFLEDENGKKQSGWKKVNNSWYYFDPANGNLTPVGWMTLDGASYYFDTNGKMHTGWLEYNSRWYFMDSTNGHMVTGWHQTSPGQSFYFTENATAAQPRGSLDEAVTHASYPNNNPPFSASAGSTASPAPSPAPGTSGGTQAAQTGGAWKTNPDGSWSYVKNGTTVKKAWEQIDGFWYYFNDKGIMQTGWQFINSRWYYLEPNAGGSNGYKCGAMWANATTPDGHTVNGDGMWVRDGQVVTTQSTGSGSSGFQNPGGSTPERTITACRISVSAVDPGPGKCKTASVTGATNCTIVSQTFSKPYEQWTPGEIVTITVELRTNEGYKFDSKTTYSCSGAKLSGQSGTQNTRTVRLSYTPVMRLDAPSFIYVTDSDELKWLPVKHGKRYKVQITGGNVDGTVTKTVSTTSIELLEYGNIDSNVMNVTISALGPEGNSSYLESAKTVINDVGSYKKDHKLNGTLEYSSGKLRYTDDSGMPVSGWQQLQGKWYHFNKSGYASGPGWLRDDSGYWYYFADDYTMMTGTITENGKSYFLNDGSRQDLPLGAWVQ